MAASSSGRQLAEENAGGGTGRREMCPRHAEAAIECNRDAQREVPGGEHRHHLWHAVLRDLEVPRRQPGHRLARATGRTGVDLDDADAGRELAGGPGADPEGEHRRAGESGSIEAVTAQSKEFLWVSGFPN